MSLRGLPGISRTRPGSARPHQRDSPGSMVKTDFRDRQLSLPLLTDHCFCVPQPSYDRRIRSRPRRRDQPRGECAQEAPVTMSGLHADG